MTDKRETVSQKEIMSLLAGKVQELAELRAAPIKYPKLTSLLSTTVKGLPADTRMPGVRDLARHLGISLVTTQRALRELTNEGILYSKSRAGIFVGQGSGPAAYAAPRAAQGSRHPFLASFDFGTDSGASYQRRFWEKLAGLFREQHPNMSAVLHFEAGKALRDRPLDVYEGYNWKRSPPEDTLDIASFAGRLLPASAIHNGLLPLYYRTHFLFYNRSLLALHGLPEPAYHTFAGQVEYLESLAPELSRLGFDPKPYSIQEPVTVYGGRVSELAALLVAGADSPASRELLEATENVLRFCRLCRYSIKPDTSWMNAREAFLNGRVPFFLGYSVDYWEFSQGGAPFSLQAYPTLCCDDTFFLLPRFGVINSRSEHPVESLSFLLFLLRPDIQEHFAATGNFGVGRSGKHPAMAADPAWVSEVLRRSPSFDLTTKERHYAISSILGGELWRALMESSSAEEVLDRAISLQRAYLQLRPEPVV